MTAILVPDDSPMTVGELFKSITIPPLFGVAYRHEDTLRISRYQPRWEAFLARDCICLWDSQQTYQEDFTYSFEPDVWKVAHSRLDPRNFVYDRESFLSDLTFLRNEYTGPLGVNLRVGPADRNGSWDLSVSRVYLFGESDVVHDKMMQTAR